MTRALTVGAVTIAAITVGLTAPAGATNPPTQLVLPQGAAFKVLGYDCGGIKEQTYATGFDATSGYPTGDAFLQTTCNGSGRGGHSTTHSAWSSVTWDLTATLVTYSTLVSAPTVDPAFSAFDAYGNEVYNASKNAYLVLTAAFTPAPRVTALSTTAGPSSGGTAVTITGSGFSGATAVDFGTAPAASYVVNNANSISAVSPATTGGTVDVTVVTAGGPSASTPSDLFTLVARPVVTKISPNQGPLGGGTTITISGSSLAAVNAVFMGDQQVGFSAVSDSAITLVTPVGEAVDSLQISVVSLGGTSATSAATVFNYTAPAPALFTTPGSGPSGKSITFSGTGFSSGETVKVSYLTGLKSPHPSSVALCSAKATSAGSFSCKGTIRKSTAGAKGLHTIVAKGSTSHKKATSTFKLT